MGHDPVHAAVTGSVEFVVVAEMVLVPLERREAVTEVASEGLRLKIAGVAVAAVAAA